ncbi:CHAT domain-containing protein, partial [Cyclobacteriaceae bacterium]|nr:CHAT domain-containing protein [Cyclobacteriaceae bacterium]
VHALSKVAQMQYITGDPKKALKTTELSIQYNMKLINDFFPNLNERAKTKFWAIHQPDFEFYNTLAFGTTDPKPKYAANVFNNSLATKALLLNSSIKLKENILDSGDSALIAKFKQYQALRESLATNISNSSSSLVAGQESIKKTQKQIDLLEKELSQDNPLFSTTIDHHSYNWQEVKAKLKEGEAAIEIIRYRYYDQNFSDSIVYIALLIDETTKKSPKIIELGNGSQMETSQLKYYRNAINYRINDEKSYSNYWEAIDQHLNGINTIYLSGEGVYNQINPETFYSNGDFLLNKYNINLITSTKDLLSPRDSSSANSSPVLIANPKYYTTPSQQQYISQLIGAEHEVKSIQDILIQDSLLPKVYIYDEATEQRLKDLDSPAFLHIASHGYFISTVSDSTQSYEIYTQRSLEDPLLKSGILLANGGYIVDNNAYFNYNKEDGVLTSLEAMNLNLDNTQFVVLSACETGLGEIKNGEGVYGLQRALKIAGAKTIFMSLFKVDDEVTDMLMTLFYQNYLQTKNTKTAFIEAKKELMKTYSAPYYWGAFIMIE